MRLRSEKLFADIIYTRRLQMRRIRGSDLPLILAWSHKEDSSGPYLTPERFSRHGLEEQFADNAFWNPHDKTFLIEKRDPALPIGTIHYWIRPDQRDSAVMSVKIADAQERNHGYGTEAQKYLIIQLFEREAVQNVLMYTDIDNGPQQRCLGKLGFSIHRTLTYDDRQVKRFGHLFRLTRKDYRTRPIYMFHYE